MPLRMVLVVTTVLYGYFACASTRSGLGHITVELHSNYAADTTGRKATE